MVEIQSLWVQLELQEIFSGNNRSDIPVPDGINHFLDDVELSRKYLKDYDACEVIRSDRLRIVKGDRAVGAIRHECPEIGDILTVHIFDLISKTTVTAYITGPLLDTDYTSSLLNHLQLRINPITLRK